MSAVSNEVAVINLLVCPICRRAFPNHGRPVSCMGEDGAKHADADTVPYRAWPFPPKESS